MLSAIECATRTVSSVVLDAVEPVEDPDEPHALSSSNAAVTTARRRKPAMTFPPSGAGIAGEYRCADTLRRVSGDGGSFAGLPATGSGDLSTSGAA